MQWQQRLSISVVYQRASQGTCSGAAFLSFNVHSPVRKQISPHGPLSSWSWAFDYIAWADRVWAVIIGLRLFNLYRTLVDLFETDIIYRKWVWPTSISSPTRSKRDRRHFVIQDGITLVHCSGCLRTKVSACYYVSANGSFLQQPQSIIVCGGHLVATRRTCIQQNRFNGLRMKGHVCIAIYSLALQYKSICICLRLTICMNSWLNHFIIKLINGWKHQHWFQSLARVNYHSFPLNMKGVIFKIQGRKIAANNYCLCKDTVE